MNILKNEIKFLHYRKFDGFTPVSNGGVTVAYYEQDGNIYFAAARCSERDNFCKSTGRIKAAGRLHSSVIRSIINSTAKEFRDAMDNYYKASYGYNRSYWGRVNVALDKASWGLYNT